MIKMIHHDTSQSFGSQVIMKQLILEALLTRWNLETSRCRSTERSPDELDVQAIVLLIIFANQRYNFCVAASRGLQLLNFQVCEVGQNWLSKCQVYQHVVMVGSMWSLEKSWQEWVGWNWVGEEMWFWRNVVLHVVLWCFIELFGSRSGSDSVADWVTVALLQCWVVSKNLANEMERKAAILVQQDVSQSSKNWWSKGWISAYCCQHSQVVEWWYSFWMCWFVAHAYHWNSYEFLMFKFVEQLLHREGRFANSCPKNNCMG